MQAPESYTIQFIQRFVYIQQSLYLLYKVKPEKKHFVTPTNKLFLIICNFLTPFLNNYYIIVIQNYFIIIMFSIIIKIPIKHFY